MGRDDRALRFAGKQPALSENGRNLFLSCSVKSLSFEHGKELGCSIREIILCC